jgi:hypothetical protein
MVSIAPVASVVITNAGSGYTAAPTLKIDAPPPPARATARVSPSNIENGVLTGDLTLGVAGENYKAGPLQQIVTISGGTGTGATATAEVNHAGHVTKVSIAIGGSGYKTTSLPTVTIAPPPNYGTAEATVQLGPNGQLQSAAVTVPGSGYTTAPQVTIPPPGGGGTQATAYAVLGPAVSTPTPFGVVSNPRCTFFGAKNAQHPWTIVTSKTTGRPAYCIHDNGMCLTMLFKAHAATATTGASGGGGQRANGDGSGSIQISIDCAGSTVSTCLNTTIDVTADDTIIDPCDGC